MDLHLKPPEEDLSGRIPPLSRSLSHVLLLSLSRRFMETQGSERVPSSFLTPRALPSFIHSCSLSAISCPMAPALSSQQKKKKEREK